MFLFKNKQTGRYYLYYFDLSGKRKCISTKAKYKPEAMKFLKNFNSIQEEKNRKKDLTVFYISDLQKEVLKYAESNFRKSTIQIYKRVFKDALRLISDKPIKLITFSDIEHYKTIRSGEVSPAMVNIDLATLKAIFNIAIRFEWININPVNKVKKLSIPEKERLSFTEEEFKLILNNIDNETIKQFVLFAYYTGCRLNEICNIQMRDVNLSDRILTIRNKPDFKTKTGKERVIPIDNELFELLSGMLREGNIFKFFNPEMYLFRNSKGFKFNKNFVSLKFKEALRKAGLPERFHFHCLRHSRITEWVKIGLPIPLIMKLAGHSQSITTQNYTHITIEDLKKALIK
ncbi:MAG: site-specific integrase [Ignavibacteria bacterium]|nr:site-specific integrase [Ignavibacteria bacterium]